MSASAAAQQFKASRRAWPALLHRMVSTVRRRGLLERGQHVLVAVSGGPDSVAVLSLLHRLSPSWKLTLTAAHFNYRLRGQESDQDERFVASLCRELGIPLHRRNLLLGNRKRGTSVQAVARDLRYEALKAIARDCGADRIAVGHTADDQAETVLLWILRGAGLAGLSGMPSTREGMFIRPLYDVTRRDILAYLDRTGQSYRRDSSNAQPVYLRNRIRHEVMPGLQRIAHSSVKVLCRLADLCREDDRYLEQEVGTLCATELRPAPHGGSSMDRAVLLALPLALQRRVVREALRRCDEQHRAASVQTVDRVIACAARGGTARVDVKSMRLVTTASRVEFIPVGRQTQKREEGRPLSSVEVTVPSVITWAGTGQQIHVCPLRGHSTPDRSVDRRRSIVLDADRFSGPLVVRTWQPGDRLCPLGMQGRSKKVQDLFTDLKVPVEQRAKIAILTAPEGILWVVGYRQDERFAAREATCRRVLVSVTDRPSTEGV